MRHEPSGSLPPVQSVADWRCPACRVIRPLDDFPTAAGSAAGGGVGERPAATN
jgi:hypothetical protein